MIDELSDYLGYAPNFAPPTYVKFARVYGRLPNDRRGLCTCRGFDDVTMYEFCCTTEVHWSDFRNKDFRTDYFGDLRVSGWLPRDEYGNYSVRVHVAPERLTAALYNPRLHLHMCDEDIKFFRHWASATGPGAGMAPYHNFWPYARNTAIRVDVHPAIIGALRIHEQYVDWRRADYR